MRTFKYTIKNNYNKNYKNYSYNYKKILRCRRKINLKTRTSSFHLRPKMSKEVDAKKQNNFNIKEQDADNATPRSYWLPP